MTICVFYHDSFCQHDVGSALFLLREENVLSVALENRPYINEEKQKLLPDKTIDELNPDDIDMFVVPGGSSIENLYNNIKLKNFIHELNARKKYIAGICWGSDLLEEYGITGHRETIMRNNEPVQYSKLYQKLIEKKTTSVVRDGNIIIAKGTGYVEFAIELGKIANVFKSEEELKAKYKWFKNPDCIYL